MSLLILGSRRDVHVQAVQWALQAKGVRVQVFDPAGFPSRRALSLDLGRSDDALLDDVLPGEDLDLRAVRAVWARRPFPAHDLSAVHPEDAAIVRHEADEVLTGLYNVLDIALQDRAVWLNPLRSRLRARSKPAQLALARRCGLTVPPTLISNDPARIRQLAATQPEGLIFKAFRPLDWAADAGRRSLPTTPLTPELLAQSQAMSLCPAIFQPEVRKQYELRVLVVDDEVRCVRIDSQADRLTATDWRLYALGASVPAQPHVLAPEDLARIRRLMQALDLRFGCLDFIVDTAGQLVFLEINPQGQFLFMDHLCPEVGALAAVCQAFATLLGLPPSDRWPRIQHYLEAMEAPAGATPARTT